MPAMQGLALLGLLPRGRQEGNMYKELISELTESNQCSEYVKIQPPCSEREIEKAEKAVGYSFPNELRALLRELNGDKYLLLSAEEIAEQAKLNRDVKEEYGDEEFAKDLDKLIFFAGNGCGDYWCYLADDNGTVDEHVIYIWEHEEYSLKHAAANMSELITRYYNGEI